MVLYVGQWVSIVFRTSNVGRPDGWSVLVEFDGMGERALEAQRSRQVRVFRRMETLVSYIKAVDIQRFNVDVADYEPRGKAHVRPDRVAALRHANETAANDKWFREEIGIAFEDADHPVSFWVSNDDAKTECAKERAEMIARIAVGDEA